MEKGKSDNSVIANCKQILNFYHSQIIVLIEIHSEIHKLRKELYIAI